MDTSIPVMTDAEYLRNHRRLLGYRQEDIADLFRVARTTIINIEHGKRRLYEHEVQALNKLGFPKCELVSEPLALPPLEAVQWELVNDKELAIIQAIRENQMLEAIRLLMAMPASE